MKKKFNTAGLCIPDRHYMVDLSSRLKETSTLIADGAYFTINKARQYGKTTILYALAEYLSADYTVISLDFQLLSHNDFENESAFVSAFAREILASFSEIHAIPPETRHKLAAFSDNPDKPYRLAVLFTCLSNWCFKSEKPIVLMIDEVDSAANNQVFLDFLSQLRGYYMHREQRAAFQSVILASVYDIRNLKQKIRPDTEHKRNSPWNIASDFTVDLSFSKKDISSMLTEYEQDYHTGMDISAVSALLHDYTSGYPFLVSRICKIIDERLPKTSNYKDKPQAWSKAGFLDAVNFLLTEKNTLFESMTGKLEDHPALRNILYTLLFHGKDIPYNALTEEIGLAELFGFIKNENSRAVVSNRIFETVLYNYFLSEEIAGSKIYDYALQNKNQFVKNGHLDMKRILQKYVTAFDDLYGDQGEVFIEEAGRRYFLLFLKPIINGTGNYYIEVQTRNMRRTDIIIDYCGEQFIIELKIWHGNEYNQRGEKQLADYLDYYHLETGYLLSYNFNKNKQIGVKEIKIGNKILIEAVV